MNSSSLVNHLLIATPGIEDPRFSFSVAYICEHSAQGAVAIIINRPLDLNLEIALHQMGIDITDQSTKHIPLCYGGPVQQERGFVVHHPFGDWQASLRPSDEISVTTSKDILQAIAHGQGPQKFLVALGYAGWSAEQLEQEIKDNAWLCCPAPSELLFNTPQNDLWVKTLSTLGISPEKLTHQYGHA